MKRKIQIVGLILFIGLGYFFAHARSIVVNPDILLFNETKIPSLYFNYIIGPGNAGISTPCDTSFSNPRQSQNLSLFVLGDAKIPLKGPLGFETMCLSYAYTAQSDLTMTMNLFRNVFHVRNHMNANFLDYVRMTPTSDYESTSMLSGPVSVPARLEKDNADSVLLTFSSANGQYTAEAWSYSLSIALWRFTLTSRFGIDARLQGTFMKKYQVQRDSQDPRALDMLTLLSSIDNYLIDSVVYSARENAKLRMPSSHTLSFDIIRDKMRISYTKTFGDMEMYHAFEDSLSSGNLKNTVDLDAGILFDHIVMLNVNHYPFFFNAGIFSMDVRIDNQRNLMRDGFTGNLPHIRWGDAVMIPLINMGTGFGTKTRIALELDVLPLFTLKAGMAYHFQRF